MKLNEKIFELRKMRNLSQEDLAAELNISRQSISRWENGTAKPDAENLLRLSKLFGISVDSLLNDDLDISNKTETSNIRKFFRSEEIKNNKILQANLTLIAIIAQAASLNTAMRPLVITDSPSFKAVEIIIRLVPLLLCSIWMAHNLKYEKDRAQYIKNVRIELIYCCTQTATALFGYFSDLYAVAAILILAFSMIYIFFINPKYMNRRLTRRISKK